MNFFRPFLLILLFIPVAQAGTGSAGLKYDSVSIGYIPSRGASFKGEPHVILEGRSLAHHKNPQIREFFVALKKLAAEGRTDNATQFHEPTQYLDVVYQGERVRLFYSGATHLEKFARYEGRWKSLHREIYRFLNRRISL